MWRMGQKQALQFVTAGGARGPSSKSGSQVGASRHSAPGDPAEGAAGAGAAVVGDVVGQQVGGHTGGCGAQHNEGRDVRCVGLCRQAQVACAAKGRQDGQGLPSRRTGNASRQKLGVRPLGKACKWVRQVGASSHQRGGHPLPATRCSPAIQNMNQRPSTMAATLPRAWAGRTRAGRHKQEPRMQWGHEARGAAVGTACPIHAVHRLQQQEHWAAPSQPPLVMGSSPEAPKLSSRGAPALNN